MTLSLIERTINTKVEPSEIKHLVDEVEKLRECGAPIGFEAQVSILKKRYGKDNLDRKFAILERMRCLQDLMEDDRMRGWTSNSQEPGCILTHEAVLDATATCRLLNKGGNFAFDPDEFFELVLRYMPSENTA